MLCLSLFSPDCKHILFSKTPSERRPREVRVFADSIFTLPREICQALCYENTWPAYSSASLGLLQHKVEIVLFHEASKCPVGFFTETLSTRHQTGCQFCKQSHSNEFGLVRWEWGGIHRVSRQWIDWLRFYFSTNCFGSLKKRGSDDLSPFECYCHQSEEGQFLTATVPFITSGCLGAKWLLPGSSNVQPWLSVIPLALWRHWQTTVDHQD